MDFNCTPSGIINTGWNTVNSKIQDAVTSLNVIHSWSGMRLCHWAHWESANSIVWPVSNIVVRLTVFPIHEFICFDLPQYQHWPPHVDFYIFFYFSCVRPYLIVKLRAEHWFTKPLSLFLFLFPSNNDTNNGPICHSWTGWKQLGIWSYQREMMTLISIFHIECGSEIQSQVATQDTCGDAFSSGLNEWS